MTEQDSQGPSEFLKLKNGWNSISHTLTKDELDAVLGEYMRMKAQSQGVLPFNVSVRIADLEIDNELGLVYLEMDAVALESMN